MKPKVLIPLILLALLILICLVDCCLLLRWVTDTEIYSQVRLQGEGVGYGVFTAREGGGEVRLTSIEDVKRLRDMLARFRPVR